MERFRTRRAPCGRGQRGGHPGSRCAGQGASQPRRGYLRSPARGPCRRHLGSSHRAAPLSGPRRSAGLALAAGGRQSARRLGMAARTGRSKHPEAAAAPARTRKPRAPPAAPGRSPPPPPPEGQLGLGQAAAAAARSSTRKCTLPASGTLQPRPLDGTTGSGWGRRSQSGGRRHSPEPEASRRRKHWLMLCRLPGRPDPWNNLWCLSPGCGCSGQSSPSWDMA